MPDHLRIFLTAGLSVGLLFGGIALMATLDPARSGLIALASFLVAGAAFTLAARR
ncbi:MAG: hypothetical protein M0R73_03850 [Dehalococcoidia bacterium]|nr:hypothetical protein [Dehalococcoidia bacterium]